MKTSRNFSDNQANRNRGGEEPRRPRHHHHQQTSAMRVGYEMPSPDVVRQQTGPAKKSPSSHEGPNFRHVAVGASVPVRSVGFAPAPGGVRLFGGGGYGFSGAPDPAVARFSPAGCFHLHQPNCLAGGSATVLNSNLHAPKQDRFAGGGGRSQIASPPAAFAATTTARVVSPPTTNNYGWDFEELVFDELDSYFPRGMLKLEIKQADVRCAFQRMQESFKRLSVQADFENDTAGARLRTPEYIELYVIFFEDKSNGTVGIDIQIHDGDYLAANRYIHQILDAARGVVLAAPEEEERPVAAPNAQRIREFEAFLNYSTLQSAGNSPGTCPEGKAPILKPLTSERDLLGVTIKRIHRSLASARMDQRRAGLDQLKIFTSLDATFSKHAITYALIVVAGVSPDPAHKQQCSDIRRVLVRAITQRDFAGDDKNMYSDMDAGITGFMSSDFPTKEEGCSRYYGRYMAEIFHLVLRIFANALQVLVVFKDVESYDLGALVSTLDSCFIESGGKGIAETLMQVIKQQADHGPAEAFLACQAMRHLVASDAALRSACRGDPVFRATVKAAIKAGAVHAKLLTEAKGLQDSFGQPAAVGCFS